MIEAAMRAFRVLLPNMTDDEEARCRQLIHGEVGYLAIRERAFVPKDVEALARLGRRVA